MRNTFFFNIFSLLFLPFTLYANTYSIETEGAYAVLINDLTKSYVEQLSEYPGDTSGKLLVSAIKGSMNMLTIKKEIMPCLSQNKISFFSRQKPNLNIVESCARPFTSQFKEKLSYFMRNPQPSLLQGALIDFLIFNPSFVEPYPAPTLADKIIFRQAFSIAITRFDNQMWHQNINACQQARKETEPSLECVKPYFDAVFAEMIPIIQELQPYRSFFQQAVPLPDKSKMRQEFSNSGQMYQWKEQ